MALAPYRPEVDLQGKLLIGSRLYALIRRRTPYFSMG
jgi:hypothetical protein